MGDARARGDGGRRAPGSPRASPSPTAAPTASRSRAGFAERAEVERCSAPWARPAGRGARSRRASSARYADIYELQPRSACPFTYTALLTSPNGGHTRARRAAPTRAGRAAPSVWPQVSPRPLTFQMHDGDAVHPQHQPGVRRADAGGRSTSALRGLRRSGVAAPRPSTTLRAARAMRPRWDTYTIVESASAPRAARAGASTDARRRAGRAPARRAARPRRRRARPRACGSGPCSPTTTTTASASCSTTSTARSACPTPAPTWASCATRRRPPTCSATGCATAACMPVETAVRKLTGVQADIFGFADRGYMREGDGPTSCVFDPDTVAPGPAAPGARLPGRRRAPHRRPAHRHDPRGRQRHADPRRRRTHRCRQRRAGRGPSARP